MFDGRKHTLRACEVDAVAAYRAPSQCTAPTTGGQREMRGDERQIHGVEHIGERVAINGIVGEEQFVADKDTNDGRSPRGDVAKTDLAAFACAFQSAKDGPIGRSRDLGLEDVQQFLVGIGDEAAIGLDADDVKVVEYGTEQCEQIVTQGLCGGDVF